MTDLVLEPSPVVPHTYVRHPDDWFATPPFAIRAILPHLPLRGFILEAGAGRGAIVRELIDAGVDAARIEAIELDPGRAADCRKLGVDVRVGDFLAMDGLPGYSCALINPPFRLALEFVQKCLEHCDTVCALLRLGFLASQERAPFHRANPCDVFVLPRRPSFTPDGKTDSSDYGFFCWGPGRGGRIVHLETEAPPPRASKRGLVEPAGATS